MGNIINTYIFTHPPLIVPEVGAGDEKYASATVASAVRAAKEISAKKPGTIIVTTPHGPLFQDYIYMSTAQRLSGNFGRFGAEQVHLEYENNLPLVNRIIQYAKKEGILSGGVDEDVVRKRKFSRELDHGALVPLYFVNKEYSSFRLVHISTSFMPYLDLYRFGMCIDKAVRDLDETVIFIASGDLSHKLTNEGPYGFNKHGPEFDELFVESLKTLDVKKLLNLKEDFCEEAGECGLRSFLMMFGALDGYSLTPQVYSYEGPFGVGYSIARFEVGERTEEREVYKSIMQENEKNVEEHRGNEDSYVELARKALETYIREERILSVPEDELPAEMILDRAGTFVSLKKRGQLRGCIGTTGPTQETIAAEIIQNVISSGTQDPRFSPVREDELPELVYSVDILREPEPIQSMEELDVFQYGVIVRSGRRSGLLLPNLEGVETPEQQVSIALQKAGIRPNEKYSMDRFEVVRHQ